jgi:hypothetical protein
MRDARDSTPAPFTDAQRAALAVMMDLLIPASPDGRMPAAKALGLYDDVATMRAGDRALLERGLATLEALALQSHGVAFARLEIVQAGALVDKMRVEQPAFVQSFIAQTVGRYVSHPVVMPLIGLEPRPLWPKGNVVAEGDWSLLEVVKRREKSYRKV